MNYMGLDQRKILICINYDLNRVYLQISLEEFFFNSLCVDFIRLSTCTYSHMTYLMSRYIVGWRKIPPNWFGGKLCSNDFFF